MHVTLLVWRKIRSFTHHETDQKPQRTRSRRDPDLLAISEIAQRRRLETERSLEAVFEKVRPILRREPESVHPALASKLPEDLKAQIAAMPDAEQRIRAILEFKSSKAGPNRQD
jgi:hypothetical protein